MDEVGEMHRLLTEAHFYLELLVVVYLRSRFFEGI